jgi:hypothetical protein
VVHPGAASAPDHHQSYQSDRSGSQTIVEHHGCNRHFRYRNQHQCILYMDTCSLANQQEVRINQRILGSLRERSLPFRRRHAQLVLPQDRQSQPHPKWPHKVQQARQIQPAHRHGLPPHGRHDHRRNVYPQLLRVRPREPLY